jgi:hypothetical protein
MEGAGEPALDPGPPGCIRRPFKILPKDGRAMLPTLIANILKQLLRIYGGAEAGVPHCDIK